jgi:hypothetical protein
MFTITVRLALLNASDCSAIFFYNVRCGERRLSDLLGGRASATLSQHTHLDEPGHNPRTDWGEQQKTRYR